jgi:DNA replication protein DnaC
LLDECTFEHYEATADWQKHALSLAQNYLEYGDNLWLFFGGMSGSGKSHLCTAVCGELLKRNNAVRYMMWDSESKALKSLVNDTYEYEKRMNELKSVKVLYIDDFLKVQRGQQPTPADINLAFEIINHRDVKNLRTIISTEKTIDDIISLDEALGGRINRRSRGYQMNIAYDKNKNFRLRK